MNTLRCTLFVSLVAAALPASAADRFDIAVTVDDLPAHGSRLPPGVTRLGIAESFVKTLKAHGVTEAYGFVNARALAVEPSSVQVLDAWRQAGYPLGNHTYSHLSLDAAESQDVWERDVEAGEAPIIPRMQNADWRYFRFPFLAAGNDPARREGAFAYLRSKGYKIADVSVSFDDWDYTDAYTRCAAKGDGASVEALKAQYLRGVDSDIARMKSTSQQVFGRVIPQVLLLHLGAFSALTLDDVLKRLDAAGARYVPLAQAQSDAAYAEPGSKDVITRTALGRGMQFSDGPRPASQVDLHAICR